MSIFHDQNTFMAATGQNANPGLYRELVREEVQELADAWDAQNEVEIADGIMDSIYVLAGLANSLWGADKAKRLWDEVQASNMSKVQVIESSDGGIEYVVRRRADGKILKPASYFKPDLQSVLDMK